MSRILIVEDDIDLQEGLAFALHTEGYEVTQAETMKEGLDQIWNHQCDFILLDCNLPDGSGFDFCVKAKEYSDIPILMLTARDTEMDEVKALELGVDDFMSKPFSLAVLKARIKKLLLRGEESIHLVSNGITVDKNGCKVYKDEKEIICSRTEYQLLVYFLENKNRVLSKEQILAHIWDHQGKFVEDNTVSVNIRRLRAKIEDDLQTPQRIKTVHGMGYVWKEGGA